MGCTSSRRFWNRNRSFLLEQAIQWFAAQPKTSRSRPLFSRLIRRRLKRGVLRSIVGQTWHFVAKRVEAGYIESAREHFLTNGYAEGRLPRDRRGQSAGGRKLIGVFALRAGLRRLSRLAIVCQLRVSQLPFGDNLETRSVQVVCSDSHAERDGLKSLHSIGHCRGS